MIKLKIVSIATFLIICQACVASLESKKEIQADAERFCALFAPEVWAEMRQKAQGAELMAEFMRRVDEAVSTDAFEKVMDRQHEQPKSADSLYSFYVKEVTKLTGVEFQYQNLHVYFKETLRSNI